MMNINGVIRFAKKEKSKAEQLRDPLVIKMTLPHALFVHFMRGCQDHHLIVSNARDKMLLIYLGSLM